MESYIIMSYRKNQIRMPHEQTDLLRAYLEHRVSRDTAYLMGSVDYTFNLYMRGVVGTAAREACASRW